MPGDSGAGDNIINVNSTAIGALAVDMNLYTEINAQDFHHLFPDITPAVKPENQYKQIPKNMACRLLFTGTLGNGPKHCILLINDAAKTAIDFGTGGLNVKTHDQVLIHDVKECFDIPKGTHGKGLDVDKMVKCANELSGFSRFRIAFDTLVKEIFIKHLPDAFDKKPDAFDKKKEKTFILENLQEKIKNCPDDLKSLMTQEFSDEYKIYRKLFMKEKSLPGQHIFAKEGFLKTYLDVLFKGKKFNFPVSRYKYSFEMYNCCKVPAIILSAGGIQSILAKASLINNTRLSPIHFVRYLKKVQTKLANIYKKECLYTQNGLLIYDRNYKQTPQNLDIEFTLAPNQINSVQDMPRFLKTISHIMKNFRGTRWIFSTPKLMDKMPALTISPPDVQTGENIMMAVETALKDAGYKPGKGKQGHVQIGEFAWHKSCPDKTPYPRLAKYLGQSNQHSTENFTQQIKVEEEINRVISSSEDKITYGEINAKNDGKLQKKSDFTNERQWEEFLSSDQSTTEDNPDPINKKPQKGFWKHCLWAYTSPMISGYALTYLLHSYGGNSLTTQGKDDAGSILGFLHGAFAEASLTHRSYTKVGLGSLAFTKFVYVPATFIMSNVKATFLSSFSLFKGLFHSYGVGAKLIWEQIVAKALTFLNTLKTFAITFGSKVKTILQWTSKGIKIVRTSSCATFLAKSASAAAILKAIIAAAIGYLVGKVMRWILDTCADIKTNTYNAIFTIPAKAIRIGFEYPFTFFYKPQEGYKWQANIDTGHMETVPTEQHTKKEEQEIFKILQNHQKAYAIKLRKKKNDIENIIWGLEQNIQQKKQLKQNIKKQIESNIERQKLDKEKKLTMVNMMGVRLTLIKNLIQTTHGLKKNIMNDQSKKVIQLSKPLFQVKNWDNETKAINRLDEVIRNLDVLLNYLIEYKKSRYFKNKPKKDQKKIHGIINIFKLKVSSLKKDSNRYKTLHKSLKEKMNVLKQRNFPSFKEMCQKLKIDNVYTNFSFTTYKAAINKLKEAWNIFKQNIKELYKNPSLLKGKIMEIEKQIEEEILQLKKTRTQLNHVSITMKSIKISLQNENTIVK